MPIKIFGIIIAMMAIFSDASAKGDCSQMTESPKVKKIAEAMTRLMRSNSYVWPEIEVSSFPVFLLDKTNFPGCAVYAENGKISGLQKTTDFPEIANEVYTFCGGFPTMPPCPSNESSSAPTAGVLYELSNDIGFAADLVGLEPWVIDFATIVHEGFHFIGQGLGSQKYGWWQGIGKMGVSQEGRDQLSKNCYAQNAKVLELTKKEINLLRYGK